MTDRLMIGKAERRLRDIVNEEPVQDHLMLNKRHWHQLCSSMDVIGDTDMAIEAYLRARVSKSDNGTLYLHTYGVLQALFLQQDAVQHAAEAIGMLYSVPDQFKAIREVRNNAVGHATKRGQSSPRSFGIIRQSLTGDGFTLCPIDIQDGGKTEQIRLKELVLKQRKLVAEIIEGMVLHLDSLRKQEVTGV